MMAMDTSITHNLSSGNESIDWSQCKYYDIPTFQCYKSDQDLLNNIYEYLELTNLEWIITVIYILVFITGVGGNFLVGYAVWRNKYLRTITNFFLTNLAVADFLTIVFCLPPSFAQTIFETWFLGYLMCKVLIYLQCFLVGCGILLAANLLVHHCKASSGWEAGPQALH